MSRTEVHTRPTKPSGIPWLGEVPAHWEVKRLKHLARKPIKNGVGESADHEDPEWPRYIRITDIAGPRDLNPETFRSLPPAIARAAVVDKNDLLLAAVGATYGKSYFHTNDSKPACYAGYLVRFSPGPSVVPEFMAYWTESSSYWDQLRSQVIQSTIQNFSSGRYQELIVLLPPLPEQRAIAAFLDERTARIDALVARKRRLVQLLKEKRQALITRAVTRGLDPKAKMKESGVPWLGEVPEGWEVVPLRHIAESIQTGPFGSQLHEADYVEGGIPLINPAHMIQGEIVPEAESAVDEATKERLVRYVLDAGDILFARRGEIGRCALVAEHQAGWMCGTGSMRLRLSDSDPGYYAILFGSRGFAEALELNAVGTTMLNINPTILARQFVPRPPRTEQTAIREYVATTTTRLDALVSKVEQAVERLQEYRTALISAAVTGKVPPTRGASADKG